MIQVREYALLTSDTSQRASMDVGIVSTATFGWLQELQQRWRGDSALLELQSRHSIKLGSYVGYLQSPNGECIEVLPKTQLQAADQNELNRSRRLLREMLLTALHIKPREANAAQLRRMNTPLHEWIVSRFLAELSTLVRRGLRFDYQQIEEESRYIRGQLNQGRQSRQTPGRATWFHIRHDIYTPNRIENRLIKTALDYALKITRDADNWRLANELAHQLSGIEACNTPQNDLPRWQTSKLMQSYNAIKPWCAILLEKLNPNFQKGTHKGIALLFPMEKLFEAFVGYCLRESLTSDAVLKREPANRQLITHRPAVSKPSQQWFQLKPDFMIENRFNPAVLDTKWKLLDSTLANGKDKYQISQNDLYQLFAYGHKYLSGAGQMMLVYPRHSGFRQALPVFNFDKKLHLWAVPFDCETRRLVSGDWEQAFPTIRPAGPALQSMAG